MYELMKRFQLSFHNKTGRTLINENEKRKEACVGRLKCLKYLFQCAIIKMLYMIGKNWGGGEMKLDKVALKA